MNAKTPFLTKALQGLRRFLDEAKVTEVSINRPGIVFVERLGSSEMERVEVPEFTAAWMVEVSQLVAGATDQHVNPEQPILSAALPTGERFQCVLPPAAPDGGAISIRKQVMNDFDLAAYENAGAFSVTKVGRHLALSDAEARIAGMLDGDRAELLRTAITERISIVVSGGTSTGKTTFLNALMKEIPSHERIITIEDTRELRPTASNTVAFLASKGEQSLARVSAQNLLEASLRMRPDRLLLGELRGAEAYTFLQAINTGHEGSLTTVHANSARSAYDRLALMVKQSGISLDRSEILEYLYDVIPLCVQLKRLADGRRVVSEIVFTKAKA